LLELEFVLNCFSNQSLTDIDIERKFIASARDSVAASVDDDWKPPPLPVAGDKLHRVMACV